MEAKVEHELKTIRAVQPAEKIEHEGDLLIEGDVGELAKVTVKNGTLAILGTVKKGANIDCFDPDALTNNGEMYNQGRWNTISDGYTKLSYANQIYSFNNGNFVLNYISVLLTDRRANLTIDTPDMLAVVREGVSYRITPKSGFVYAEAIVNGKVYSGKSIEVVNGIVSPKDAPSSTENFKPKRPCKMVIYGHIEASVVLKYDDLQFEGNVGDFCTIESKIGGFTAKNIGEGTVVNVAKEIKAVAVDKNSAIISSTASVKIGKIGGCSTIKARESITADSVGSGSELTSSCKHVKITGSCGNKVTIKASEQVVCDDIGDKSTITSSCRSVTVNNLGDGVTIRASDNIVVNGFCPHTADLKSSCGTVKKTNPQTRPNKKEASNVDASATNLRKNQGLPQQSFFAPKTEKGNISSSFLCPLTGKIMQSPSFFTLDGTTYEEQAIRPWLTFYPFSPQNQQIRMKHNQSVDDVLFPNSVIKKQIDEFKNEQPVEGMKFN